MTNGQNRTQCIATIVFIAVRHFKSIAPDIAARCVATLHEELRKIIPSLGAGVEVLSTLSGAIIVIPDTCNLYVHRYLCTIFDNCHGAGLPIRIGVTHGLIECLPDVDGTPNRIGECINTAARLATNNDNSSLLYHETYNKYAVAIIDHEPSPLHPREMMALTVSGKNHDAPIQAHRPQGDSPPVLNNVEVGRLHQIPADVKTITGIALSYDLPQFSAGDTSQLSKRFRSVVDVFSLLKSTFSLKDDQIFFSPGGDGGIFVITNIDGLVKEVVHKLQDLLEAESDDKTQAISSKCRLGAHYGPITLYKNAMNVYRPTGQVCFVSDDIIADEEAKMVDDVVFTEALRDLLSQGNSSRFTEKFREIPAIASGIAKGMRRYVKKSPAPSGVSHPIRDYLAAPNAPWQPDEGGKRTK